VTGVGSEGQDNAVPSAVLHVCNRYTRAYKMARERIGPLETVDSDVLPGLSQGCFENRLGHNANLL
jgi:hypothetical protein